MHSCKSDAIRTIEEIKFNQSGNLLTHKQYMATLTATAQQIDKSKLLKVTRPQHSPRNVYLHKIGDQGDVFLDNEEILSDYDDSNECSLCNSYDISTIAFGISKVSINLKAHLPPQAWYDLWK